MGFALGFILMLVATRVFLVNSYDFDNMRRGTQLLLSGVNPWAELTRIPDFYNPPHSVLFLWPMIITSPEFFLIIGAASLFAFVFHQRAWVALAWFATNTPLYLIAAGGIDMFVIGAGLLFLLAGDEAFRTKRGVVFRLIAYGLLMIKPQGGAFIVILYILSRRDWMGAILAFTLYGLIFLPLYPDWFDVIILDPPLAQTEVTRTIWAGFGPISAMIIALGLLLSRRWEYWQLGGSFAGILTPYGMTGVPSFLALTAVKSLKAAPIVVVWSAAMAILTWVSPPLDVDYYDYLQPFMAIFHLATLGLALILACLSPDEEGLQVISVNEWTKRHFLQVIGRWSKT